MSLIKYRVIDKLLIALNYEYYKIIDEHIEPILDVTFWYDLTPIWFFFEYDVEQRIRKDI